MGRLQNNVPTHLVSQVSENLDSPVVAKSMLLATEQLRERIGGERFLDTDTLHRVPAMWLMNPSQVDAVIQIFGHRFSTVVRLARQGQSSPHACSSHRLCLLAVVDRGE